MTAYWGLRETSVAVFDVLVRFATILSIALATSLTARAEGRRNFRLTVKTYLYQMQHVIFESALRCVADVC